MPIQDHTQTDINENQTAQSSHNNNTHENQGKYLKMQFLILF